MHISYNTFSEQGENEGERNYFNCNSDFTANYIESVIDKER